MARVGIVTEGAVGVDLAKLRPLARHREGDHELAQPPWETGVREHRILATSVDQPAAVRRRPAGSMGRWPRLVGRLYAMCALFARSPLWVAAARRWAPDEREKEAAGRRELVVEFVRRAGFVLIAIAARHDRTLGDEVLLPLVTDLVPPVVADERNYVKKGVSWACAGPACGTPRCNPQIVLLATALRAPPERAARWIGADALRELRARAPHAGGRTYNAAHGARRRRA